MPELPDVEVFKQYLDSTGLHQRIRGVDVSADGMLDGTSRRTLRSALDGHELASTRRYGKHLFARITSNDWLRLHFGMTGTLKYFKRDESRPDHVRLRLDFANGYHLAFTNTRKFGKIGLVDDVDSWIEQKNLGPDALGLNLAGFRAALSDHRGLIKSTLMRQSVIAGIGNVYADEILFAAGVHPKARTEDLSDDTIRDLHRAMTKVLRAAIDARTEADRFPKSFLLLHRESEGRCPRCGRPLRRTSVSGRTTYFCPHDQTRKG